MSLDELTASDPILEAQYVPGILEHSTGTPRQSIDRVKLHPKSFGGHVMCSRVRLIFHEFISQFHSNFWVICIRKLELMELTSKDF